jgi:hypothetical protein
MAHIFKTNTIEMGANDIGMGITPLETTESRYQDCILIKHIFMLKAARGLLFTGYYTPYY